MTGGNKMKKDVANSLQMYFLTVMKSWVELLGCACSPAAFQRQSDLWNKCWVETGIRNAHVQFAGLSLEYGNIISGDYCNVISKPWFRALFVLFLKGYIIQNKRRQCVGIIGFYRHSLIGHDFM